MSQTEYKLKGCTGHLLSAKKQRAAVYNGDDTPRLWTGEAPRAGETIDTSEIDKPPGSRRSFVGYVGSLRVDYEAEPAELVTDIENIKAASSSKFDPEEKVTVNFDKATMGYFLKQMLTGALGVNYIAPSDFEGTITFKTEQPISKGQVLQVVRDILSRNGLAMRYLNGVYQIATPDAITALEQTSASGRIGEQVTRVVRIRKGAAADIISFVRQLVPDDVTLASVNGGDSIIVNAQPTDIDKVSELVTSMSDGRVAEDRVAIIRLRQSAPERIASHLLDFYRARLGANGSDAVTIIPLENQQSLLVGAKDRRVMEGVKQLATQLDQEGGVDDTTLRIIALKYLTAADVAPQLTTLFNSQQGANGAAASSSGSPTGQPPPGTIGGSGQKQSAPPLPGAPRIAPVAPAPYTDFSFDDGKTTTPGPTNAPVYNRGPPGSREAAKPSEGDAPVAASSTTTGASVRIVADTRNNSIMIYSTYAVFKRVRDVLKSLDVPQSQIVIEATIAEVQLTDNLEHGVQAYLNAAGIGSVRSSTNLTPPTTGTSAGGFAHLGINSGKFSADIVLNALQKITTVKVISSPYLTVRDGKTARLVIGDQIPYITRTQQTTLSGTSTTTDELQIKDTGIVLEITPSIRSDNSALLVVDQEVTKPRIDEFSGKVAPTISTRTMKSDVIVQSGRTILLGGLIQERIERIENGIPVVRSIPALGDLFKQTTDTTSRIELIVLITPRVIRQSSQIENIARLLKDQIHSR